MSLDSSCEQFDINFKKNGWFVLDLVETKSLIHVRNEILNELKKITKESHITLETYHQYFQDHDQHTQNQLHMAEFYRSNRFGFQIMQEQIPFFRRVISSDLKVQKTPFLRITRPQKSEDNIGFHRDTFYGGSPYELSVLVTFVDLNEKNTLSVLTGSHTMSEDLFPTTQIKNPDPKVFKGSPKHLLGFPYAPKVLDVKLTNKVTPIPLRLGQALIFSLSTLHGSIVNSGESTRWSSDIRVMNAMAPVDCSLRPEYYEVLSESVVTSSSKAYFDAQSTNQNKITEAGY